MVTQQEAENLVKELYSDILPSGKVELLENYYTTDFIGHYNNDEFYLEDLKYRALIYKTHVRDLKIDLQKVMVLDQFVIFSCDIVWLNTVSNKLSSVMNVVVWLLEEHKIKESWIIIDKDQGSFIEANKDFITFNEQFEVNYKNKQGYLDVLDVILKNGEDMPEKLSLVEKECIYYYLNGFSSKETAIEMNLSPRTVEKYILQIKEKFKCGSRFELRSKLFP